MAYIGNTNTTQGFIPAVDYFNGDGATVAFTLSRPVASVAQVQAVIENVPQAPGDAYTVSGNTLTFTSAPPLGTGNIYVYYTSPITQVIQPGQDTVGLTQLSASGTPSSSTYLRGDNTWAAIASSQWTTTGSDIYYNTGNVGIGTASPQLKLHTVGPQGTVASFPILTGNSTAVFENALNTKIALVNSGAAGTSSIVESYASGDLQPRVSIFFNSPSSFFSVNTGSGSVAPTERMRIDGSGNVGIGTNSPTQRLDVRGGNGTGGISGSGGTWAAQVIMNQDSDGQSGLSVQTRWANASTPIFEAAKGWNGSSNGYYPVFNVLGDGTFGAAISGGNTTFPAFFPRVFVNFNGTGTPSIRSSGNVSSISDLGTGTYNINFSTAMPDTNYCTVTGCSEGGGAGNLKSSGARPASTSAVTVVTGDNNTDNLQDFDNVNVTVFR